MNITLITGANKGIGFETARTIGGTVLVGARDESRGSDAVATLTGEGVDARFVRVDGVRETFETNVFGVITKELLDTPIKVNAVNPGYCATDLNAHNGYRTPAQGAAVVIGAAHLGPDGPTGTFFTDDGVVLPW
jgi:NAD(P)-dependent dehydrogenase (short-subunit alcohol dehydrogenase family)